MGELDLRDGHHLADWSTAISRGLYHGAVATRIRVRRGGLGPGGLDSAPDRLTGVFGFGPTREGTLNFVFQYLNELIWEANV